MPDICAECGATVPDGGACRDNFNALLLLEWQIFGTAGASEPSGIGALSHFYAVASYALQHPDSMNYTEEALVGLRTAVADVLDGKATLDDIRLRNRQAMEGSTRVCRRAGVAEVPWKRGAWSMTVADVLTVEPDAEAYAERVKSWARSIREALDDEGE